jgi:phytoene dehydrogenase-like protein
MENMEFLKAILAKMNVNMKTDREQMKQEVRADREKLQEMMNEMKYEIKEYMNAIRKADREDVKEMMEEMMNAKQAMTKTNQERFEDMESEVEHREVPKEDAVGKAVKGRKNGHRSRKLAAERRG